MLGKPTRNEDNRGEKGEGNGVIRLTMQNYVETPLLLKNALSLSALPARFANETRIAAVVLYGLLFTMAKPLVAGSIEERDGKTIIHIISAVSPDAIQTNAVSRADVAALEQFKKDFPSLFRKKYRDKYRTHPGIYGNYNWDNVEVDVSPFSALQVEGVETDLMAIAGGIAPDLLYLKFRKIDNYIRNGFLYPLDEPQDGYLTSMNQQELDFRINPAFWPVIRRKGPAGETHVWALPFGGALGRVLLYRKDLFDEKHIPYPNENWTWDDLLTAVKKLTDASRGTYGMEMGAGKDESWNWLCFLREAGGDAMAYDQATDTWRCTFDSPQAITALDFYLRLVTEKWVDGNGNVRRGYVYRDPDQYTPWQRGQIGMMQSYVSEELFSTINPELVGMAPLPKGPTGVRSGESNSLMMGLFAGIRSPAVRDAAWEYMNFFGGEEAQRLRTRVMVEGGFGAFVNPKYLDMFGYPEMERLSPMGWAKTVEITMKTAQPEPYGKNSNFAYKFMTMPIQQAEELSMNDALPINQTKRRQVLARLLVDANARANDQMIGIVLPKERLKRRILAIVILGVIVAAFAYVFWSIPKVLSRRSVGLVVSARVKRHTIWPYILLLPAVLTILVWQYFPLARGSLMAFQNYRLMGESRWVGLDNFGDLIVNSFWWQSLWNSLRYSLLVIALTFLPPILLAILLQEIPRCTILFRTIYYLPAVVTGLVATLLWKQFYDPSEAGVLNSIVLKMPAGLFVLLGIGLLIGAAMLGWRLWYHEMRLGAAFTWVAAIALFTACFAMASPVLLPRGESFTEAIPHLLPRLFMKALEPYNWLQDPQTAMLSCVIPMVWAGIGPGCLIYLAALKGIPDDYYEVADLDGATFIDKVLFVIFPIMKPLLIIQFVGVFIGSFYGAGGNILAMTGGGANTEVADLHIWYEAFTFLKFGSATAMAWMLGLLLIGFTIYQLRILARVEFRAAEDKGK
jgi:multiple sugar transport system permease protein